MIKLLVHLVIKYIEVPSNSLMRRARYVLRLCRAVQGFREFVKRSRLGCYTGSSVWGRVKEFQGSGWQRSGCQGFLRVQGGFWVRGETLVDC